MKRHEPFLELAAAGIDFPLSAPERERLDQHLAACPACAGSVTDLRGDALALGRLPAVTLPERRAAELLATILHRQAVGHPLRLLAVAALLGLALVATLIAGAGLLRDPDDQFVVVPPQPTASVPPASPEATGVPSPTPAPSPSLPPGYVWDEATVPVVVDRPVGTIEAVTAGGPGFVAVGRGCTGLDPVCEAVVWTSIDGRTWTRIPASEATDLGAMFPTSGPQIGMFDVTADDRGVVAIGYDSLPCNAGICPSSEMQALAWFSRDGTSWERVFLGDAASTRVNAVATDGRRFVIVGEDRSTLTGSNRATATARAAVWTSDDGRTWTRVPHTAVFEVGGFIDTTEDPSMGGMADVVSGPAGLVAVGTTCGYGLNTFEGRPTDCDAVAWTSSDGLAWDRVPDVLAEAALLQSVAASEDGYLAVGLSLCDVQTAQDGQCPALVLTSGDGRSWAAQPFPQDSELRSVTRIGDRFFAVTPWGATQVWVTLDGTSWVPADVEGGPAAVDPGGDVILGASRSTAVWIGTPADGDDLVAWVSDGSGPSAQP